MTMSHFLCLSESREVGMNLFFQDNTGTTVIHRTKTPISSSFLSLYRGPFLSSEPPPLLLCASPQHRSCLLT